MIRIVAFNGTSRLVSRELASSVPMWSNLLGDLGDTTEISHPKQVPDLWCLDRIIEHCAHYGNANPPRDRDDLYTCDAWETEWIRNWPQPTEAPTNANRRVLAMIETADYLQLDNLRVACRSTMLRRYEEFWEAWLRDNPEPTLVIVSTDDLSQRRQHWLCRLLDAVFAFAGCMDEKEQGPFAWSAEQAPDLLNRYLASC